MSLVCDLFSASLISSLILLCTATVIFGFGEFLDTRISTIESLPLIGFILVLNSAIFSILAVIFKNRLSRNDLFKLLLTVLIYGIFAVIFMISGWNEWRKAGKSGFTFYMLLIGIIFALLAIIPILVAIFYTKRIIINRLIIYLTQKVTLIILYFQILVAIVK